MLCLIYVLFFLEVLKIEYCAYKPQGGACAAGYRALVSNSLNKTNLLFPNSVVICSSCYWLFLYVVFILSPNVLRKAVVNIYHSK